MKDTISLFWFRRDLRLDDNKGLYEALKSSDNVLPLFIFDENILGRLTDKDDRRVSYIYNHIERIKEHLEEKGSSLLVLHGYPQDIFKDLLTKYSINAVYTNHDYEPYARERDKSIKSLLDDHDVAFHTFKDQVIFEKDDILKDDGKPYSVYSPYMKKWKEKFNELEIKDYGIRDLFENFFKTEPLPIPGLKKMGFRTASVNNLIFKLDIDKIKEYDNKRDYPGIDGTTRVGVHLRFGTVSLRNMVKIAEASNDIYLNELIWREFYMMILWHYPHTVYKSFKPGYDRIPWRNDEKEFNAWCRGETGYPMVDAGMRELNQTGYMHNRSRMITASFLTKHLLVDWRWGEAYFADKLLDYEQSSNVGGWQWAAGSGNDAAPYFRIFNPEAQQKKFDPGKKYINKWVPEAGTSRYPKEIVGHKFARERALNVYQNALKS